MPPFHIAVKRISIALAIGLVMGVLINEISYLLLGETSRAPQVIQLVIPAGTAEGIGRGESPPEIPTSMDFVVGDTLLVNNLDASDHQLGPLWIPAGASASLLLDSAQSFSYDCSFQTNSVFGLDVHEPLTTSIRINGILSAGLPLGFLFALYSLILPVKKKPDAPENF